MHTYSINSDERKLVPLWLALCSIAIVTLLKKSTTLPAWMPVPGVFAVFGLLYTLFDRCCWKWKCFHALGLVKTPDLNGEWNTISNSSFNNFEKDYEGMVKICQTWTHISINLLGEKFSSTSLMAGIEIKTDTIFTLKWEYLSKKKPEFADQDYMHTGMTRIDALNDEPTVKLKGDYFTDRSRHNYGKFIMYK
jgi:hypothetical protein